jgi:Flp pilus assembly protein TadG
VDRRRVHVNGRVFEQWELGHDRRTIDQQRHAEPIRWLLRRHDHGWAVAMRIIRRLRSARGQGLVEFAFVLPIIVLLILGTIDLGRAVYAYNTLAESARQANRLAIVDQDTTAVQNRAILAAPALNLATANVNVCFKSATTTQVDCSNSTDDCSSDLQIGCLAFVTSNTQFNLVTPGLSGLFNMVFKSSTVGMSSTSVGPIEYVCPTASQSTCP